MMIMTTTVLTMEMVVTLMAIAVVMMKMIMMMTPCNVTSPHTPASREHIISCLGTDSCLSSHTHIRHNLHDLVHIYTAKT